LSKGTLMTKTAKPELSCDKNFLEKQSGLEWTCTGEGVRHLKENLIGKGQNCSVNCPDNKTMDVEFDEVFCSDCRFNSSFPFPSLCLTNSWKWKNENYVEYPELRKLKNYCKKLVSKCEDFKKSGKEYKWFCSNDTNVGSVCLLECKFKQNKKSPVDGLQVKCNEEGYWKAKNTVLIGYKFDSEVLEDKLDFSSLLCRWKNEL